MIDLTIFPDCVKMAELEQRLIAGSEREGRTLLRFLRLEKSSKSKDGKLIPYLLPQAEEPLSKMIAIEARLEELEKDAQEFAALIENYPSVNALADLLLREQNKIALSERNARVAYEQALRNHPKMDIDQVREIESVRKVAQKAEGIKAETTLIVADLENKLSKCQEILKKYN
jgi:hypothetical protein